MKKLLILLSIILFSCGPTKEEMAKSGTSSKNIPTSRYAGLTQIKVDSCQYLLYSDGSSAALIHQQNCKNHKNTSYQFQIINQENALLYDGEKLIGKFKFSHTELDSLIERDNL